MLCVFAASSTHARSAIVDLRFWDAPSPRVLMAQASTLVLETCQRVCEQATHVHIDDDGAAMRRLQVCSQSFVHR